MCNLPFRNPTFVLEPGNRNRVVRERFGPLKDQIRATAKIKQGSELTDVNRVTLEFKDPKVLELAFRCIEATRDYAIVCVKNKLNETNQPPCIHLNVAVKSGQSKYEHDWICEIQMYLRSVLRIKTTSHIFYNVARAENEFAIKDFQEKSTSSPPPASSGFKFNNETLKAAAKEWCTNSSAAEAKYGDIRFWDTLVAHSASIICIF
ncbi:hypothetical protein TrST_g11236 [Triparma strigata]|uniref:Uncharacterized protein n=1 Tax=Triparma strigata TaxID=1606541 RepID=A0A9W7BAE2_9STRA|nr:hypothetical protein TrST_g11236 [Triparma strigata]